MTRHAFEIALAQGRLQIRVAWGPANIKWYTVRRNGRTRTWKRDPARFEIPLKYSYRTYLTITDTQFNTGQVDGWFRIAAPTEESL